MAVSSRKDEYFDELETMSAADRKKYLDKKLAEKVSYSYSHAPAVKNLLDSAGVSPEDIRTVKDLQKLPVTRKTDLLEMQKSHLPYGGILFHEAIKDCGVTVVVAGTGNTDLQIQIMKDLKVTGFVGTPSFLNTVIKRAEEMGHNVKQVLSIKRAWFTGEMLPPSPRKVFEEQYDIDTYQAYAVH